MSNNITTEESLFDEFPPVSREEWEKVIETDLKGSDYREKLNWDTGEGIEALPFYRKEDLETLDHTGLVPSAKRKKNKWSICQPITDKNVSDANQTARTAIERGADALQIRLRIHQAAGLLGGDIEGTSIQSQKDVKTLLNGLPVERITLYLDTGMASPILLAMLYNDIKERETDPEEVSAALLYDPYAYISTAGHLPKPEKKFLGEAAAMVHLCNQHFDNLRCLGIDARSYHNTGATVVEELAFALSTGSEYLAKLGERGFSVDEIASRIFFSFSIGSNYFIEIAKFRAVRLLWQKIVAAYGSERDDFTPAYIHGQTSEWNKTVFDPYTNMLRTTTEGMAGAIAGCDLLTVNPFDMVFKEPDEFSQRIARNAQIIFKEEAYLDEVYDPAAGSYYIEVLTDKIASEAWHHFQEIEKQGGFLRAITSGTVAQMIQESARKRNEAIARRGRIFVGTNQYPNPEDRMSDQLDSEFRSESLQESEEDFDVDRRRIIESLAEAFNQGAKLGDIVQVLQARGKQLFRPIQPYRGTEAFEQLRLATEINSSVPAVFVLPAGDRKMRKLRSTFAANFFGCAGYKIIDHIGFETIEEAIREVREIQPEIVVICSSDEEYKELVGPICEQLDTLEKRPVVVLAGNPKEEKAKYQKAGVDEFIHRKSNVLETLKQFHRKLGIEHGFR